MLTENCDYELIHETEISPDDDIVEMSLDDFLTAKFGNNQEHKEKFIKENGDKITTEAKNLIYKIKVDPRLKNLNALVLLALKQKGRGTTFQPISKEGFKEIIDYALELEVPIGFDSCSANRFTEYAKERSIEWYESIAHMIEPCESFGMFSSYINVEGKYFPCSFLEGSCKDWMEGVDCTKITSFTDEVWKTPLLNKWKLISLKNDRNCPVFNV